MGSLLRSVTNAAISVLAVLTIMAILNIPLTPILASAGVGASPWASAPKAWSRTICPASS